MLLSHPHYLSQQLVVVLEGQSSGVQFSNTMIIKTNLSIDGGGRCMLDGVGAGWEMK
ncbi:MAG: hypothetical protein QS721_00670 [Candidatus Endonucleobacter sp. (ex Gigantidas childressi)]|nr:hypothetical protein [Candidatus Endonucleobacter sp. (ex Gigantidas childressi)]